MLGARARAANGWVQARRQRRSFELATFSGLLQAADPEIQREAVANASRLFSNVERAGIDCHPPTTDEEPSNPGAAFDDLDLEF